MGSVESCQPVMSYAARPGSLNFTLQQRERYCPTGKVTPQVNKRYELISQRWQASAESNEM